MSHLNLLIPEFACVLSSSPPFLACPFYPWQVLDLAPARELLRTSLNSFSVAMKLLMRKHQLLTTGPWTLFFFLMSCIVHQLFLAKASRSLSDHSELVTLTFFCDSSLLFCLTRWLLVFEVRAGLSCVLLLTPLGPRILMLWVVWNTCWRQEQFQI